MPPPRTAAGASGTRRPARDIIDAVVDNMRQNLEQLKYSTLAPSRYVVYLHPNEYSRLDGIIPILQEQTTRALAEELARLNRRAAGAPVGRAVARGIRAGDQQPGAGLASRVPCRPRRRHERRRSADRFGAPVAGKERPWRRRTYAPDHDRSRPAGDVDARTDGEPHRDRRRVAGPRPGRIRRRRGSPLVRDREGLGHDRSRRNCATPSTSGLPRRPTCRVNMRAFAAIPKPAGSF